MTEIEYLTDQFSRFSGNLKPSVDINRNTIMAYTSYSDCWVSSSKLPDRYRFELWEDGVDMGIYLEFPKKGYKI